MKPSIRVVGIRVKAGVKAGGLGWWNHNSAPKRVGVRVKSVIKAGGWGSSNHNTALKLSRSV